MQLYKHTQRGTVVVVAMGIVAGLIVVLFGGFLRGPAPVSRLWVGIIPLLVVLASGVVFSSLTVWVSADVLRWRFGPGPFGMTVALGEIATIEPADRRLVRGWGVHWTRQGWLYNVSGFGAVHVVLRGGTQFLLGTDEPEALCTAVTQAQRGVDETGFSN